MKKPIFTKAFWIFLLLGFLVSGFFFIMSIIPLFDFEMPESRLATYEKWSGLLTWSILGAGVLQLLMANIAYLREKTKGFQFVVTGIFLAAFLYLDWTFLGNKAFSYRAKFVSVNVGDNFAIIWGYVFAGVAFLGCIANWVLLFRRRKAQAVVSDDGGHVSSVSATPTASPKDPTGT